MVSIIIATYNSEKTLRRALDSVLNQSYQDWECIVVDGASKDNTIGIVKEYVKKDSRFRYISEPDHGIYDAFNKGWKMAKGQWVMYLGSDDEYTKDGIKVLMENSDGADVVYGAVYLSYPNGKQKFQQSYDSKCLFKGRFMPCCHQSLMMKRHIIENLGGFDESYKILAEESKKVEGVTFIWFTDGCGWNSARHNLEETFDVLDTVYNIQDLEDGILNNI